VARALSPVARDALQEDLLLARAASAGRNLSTEKVLSLSEKFQCNARQVYATSAWITIAAKRALREHPCQKSVDEIVRLAVELRTQAANSDEETLKAGLSSADSVEQLRCCVKKFEQLLPKGKKSCTEAPPPVSGTEPLPMLSSPLNTLSVPERGSSEVASLGPPATKRRSPGAAFTDYDFPVKELWRSRWARFLDAHTSSRDRPYMRGLCLSSAKVEREVKYYLELGFRPQNITVVEGDPRVKDEFLQNARALGVTSIFGRLQDVLPQIREPFGFVSLDFPGQFCEGYQQILRQVPVTQRCVLLINLMARRESGSAQEEMRRAATHAGVGPQRFYDTLDLKRVRQITTGFADPGLSDKNDSSLAELRVLGSLPGMVNHLGADRGPETKPAAYFAEMLGLTLQKALSAELVHYRLRDSAQVEEWTSLCSDFWSLFHKLAGGHSVRREALEALSYTSEAASSPVFQSVFVKCSTPAPLRWRYAQLVPELVQFVDRFLETPVVDGKAADLNYRVRVMQGQQVKARNTILDGATHVELALNKAVCRMTFGKLLAALRTFKAELGSVPWPKRFESLDGGPTVDA
jgi:hypothetical protein